MTVYSKNPLLVGLYSSGDVQGIQSSVRTTTPSRVIIMILFIQTCTCICSAKKHGIFETEKCFDILQYQRVYLKSYDQMYNLQVVPCAENNWRDPRHVHQEACMRKYRSSGFYLLCQFQATQEKEWRQSSHEFPSPMRHAYKLFTIRNN